MNSKIRTMASARMENWFCPTRRQLTHIMCSWKSREEMRFPLRAFEPPRHPAAVVRWAVRERINLALRVSWPRPCWPRLLAKCRVRYTPWGRGVSEECCSGARGQAENAFLNGFYAWRGLLMFDTCRKFTARAVPALHCGQWLMFSKNANANANRSGNENANAFLRTLTRSWLECRIPAPFLGSFGTPKKKATKIEWMLWIFLVDINLLRSELFQLFPLLCLNISFLRDVQIHWLLTANRV